MRAVRLVAPVVAGYEITVLRADRRRVRLLKVTRAPKRPGEESAPPAGG